MVLISEEVIEVPQLHFGRTYGGSAPENYERYFVPAIGAPVADDLIKIAALRDNERVLDVACGTGVVTRLAAKSISASGFVAGLDVNPGMLEVARKATSPEIAIEWHEASAEEMPFQDGAFDVVLCQMGLQFMPNRPAVVNEMRRVLSPGGRIIINIPGPTPPIFSVLKEALDSVIAPGAGGFVNQIFSLYDTAEIQSLLGNAGFVEISVETHKKPLRLPAPEDFLWQFVYSTPLAAVVAGAEREHLTSLEQNVLVEWTQFVQDHALMVEVGMVTATARKD